MKYLIVLICLVILSACTGNVTNPINPPNEANQPNGELVYAEDEALQEQLAAIGEEAKGKLGVFALLMEDERAVSFNGNDRFAMQSVVKLPVSMLVMQQVAEGKLTLEQKIKFTKDDLVNPNQRSPLRDKNPKGGEVTVNELIRLALVESDGTACDVLTRIVGGTAAVQAYIESIGISDMQMKRTHKEFGLDWQMQYENWATPEAAVELLDELNRRVDTERQEATRTPSPTDVDALTGFRLLENYMFLSKPGEKRLRGLLPETAHVAHKTGTGGTKDGVTSATNDIGIITLPNGKHIAIAVLVGDSSADEKGRELVIAKVAKAVWDTWEK